MIHLQGGSGLCGIAFSPDGNLFACSTRDARLLCVTGESKLVKYASTDGAPTGVAIDKSGTILVADAAHGGILEILEDGSSRVILKEFERVSLRVSGNGNKCWKERRLSRHITLTPLLPHPLSLLPPQPRSLPHRVLTVWCLIARARCILQTVGQRATRGSTTP